MITGIIFRNSDGFPVGQVAASTQSEIIGNVPKNPPATYMRIVENGVDYTTVDPGGDPDWPIVTP